MGTPGPILIVGGGMFGRAMQSLAVENGVPALIVDQHECADRSYRMVILATPVSAIREALTDNRIAFQEDTIVVSCSKGIEQESCLLPHQIFAALDLPGKYHTLAGPSFAQEIMERKPTVVDIACDNEERDFEEIQATLATPYFKLEQHDSVLEIELAGAMKNVYAVAAGYLRGVGGGANTHAHLQVVALREYQLLARALEKKNDVVRPSIVGDLELTSGNRESRNYRYGFARAEGGDMPNDTVEGKNAVAPLLALAGRAGIALPLAGAVECIVVDGPAAKQALFIALGF